MKYLFIILFFISSSLVLAQNKENAKPFTLGEVQKIQSSILKETRTLNIYLPDGYSADSAKTYPVIYLLDGSANEDFIHIVGLVQFLVMIEKMPQSIVVGIANIDRKRDFTFPTTVEKDLKDFPTTGKSASFITFIEKELQPFINEKYKAGTSKTIIGQSLGGLLATEILLKKSQLFNNYIIISPSLWWDNESLLVGAKMASSKIIDSKVYISVGTEGKKMEVDAKKLADLLKVNKNISTTFNPMPKEDHLTILHNSAYQGLEFIFQKTK
ncbi:alpha/beta hydrolase [Pedobacter frigidisoli]|uniref:Alpha/beta hydrolase n=1 Tax=Pedobacter frigidisoli TaxID=2530455 RepID=A0A4R0NTH0_9SPHI|nr:alpha/beta hydrolase-fold protein [Pedobacter frigidisoli]TCD04597.1 alpha/beta hydrolase [Pedobacter frigidisoli]